MAIALDPNENPGICYAYDDNVGADESTVRYEWYDGSSWTSETVESGLATDPPDYFSMEYDSVGRVHLVYYDKSTDDGVLKYARRNDW